MNILIVNGGNSALLARPYLNKYTPDMTIENSIHVDETADLQFIGTEKEALQMMAQYQFDSLIISTGGDVNGCYLLEKIRRSDSLKTIPVTII